MVKLLENWREVFLDERERQEVAFCETYVRDYGHGTAGHLERVIIAKLADVLDQVQTRVNVQIAVTREER